MKTRKYSARMKLNKGIGFLLVFLAALALSSCSSGDQADSTSCPIGTSVSIDVTDARPQEIFDLLSDQLDCRITVYPFFMHRVTVHMQKVPASDVIDSVCQQLDAKWIYNEGEQLSIKPLSIIDKIRAKQGEEFNQMMAERRMILQSQVPDGTSFEAVPLSTVLEEISEVSGLTIKPWEDEGDRLVSMDVSGMSVEEALKALVLYVDGEGAVLIEQKYFLHHSWGQYWLF